MLVLVLEHEWSSRLGLVLVLEQVSQKHNTAYAKLASGAGGPMNDPTGCVAFVVDPDLCEAVHTYLDTDVFSSEATLDALSANGINGFCGFPLVEDYSEDEQVCSLCSLCSNIFIHVLSGRPLKVTLR